MEQKKSRNWKSAGILLICAGAIAAAAMLHTEGGGTHQQLPWMTSFPQAMAAARAEHKTVLLDFGGSNWCPVCQLLEKHVYDTKAFADYAATNLVLVNIDLPEYAPKAGTIEETNENLAHEFKIDPLPTVILLDAQSNLLVRLEGYSGEPAADYVARLDQIIHGKTAAAR